MMESLVGAACLPPIESSPRTTAPQRRANKVAGQRFQQVNNFVDIAMAELNRGEIAVFMVLWRDEHDGNIRVCQESVAERAGMQKRNCQKAIKSLISKGIIKVIRQGGLNRGPSIYQIQKPTDWRLNSGG